jgi:predicted Holliday junction resolvase-like endonuclease
MNKSTLVIFGQTVLIITLGVFAYTQDVVAKTAQREAQLQRAMAEKQAEMAERAQREANEQMAMALASAEEARRQAEIAMRLSQKCK